MSPVRPTTMVSVDASGVVVALAAPPHAVPMIAVAASNPAVPKRVVCRMIGPLPPHADWSRPLV